MELLSFLASSALQGSLLHGKQEAKWSKNRKESGKDIALEDIPSVTQVLQAALYAAALQPPNGPTETLNPLTN